MASERDHRSGRTSPPAEVLEELQRRMSLGGSLTLVMRDVPPEHARSGEGWALRLSPVEGDRVLLETWGLRYVGPDAQRRILLAERRARADGFTRLALIPAGTPEQTFQTAWWALGWRGVEAADPNAHDAHPGHPAPARMGSQQEPNEDPPPPTPDLPGIRDLVAEARAGRVRMPLARDREIDECIRVLSKKMKAGGVLVGEAGVGKTAIAEGLACRIAQGRVPPSLAEATLMEVNLGLLASGATHQNEFEGRMREVLEMARDNPRVILFLDEIHMIRDPRSDASQLVKADLGRGRIRCLGATTPGEYRALEEDPALRRRFQRIPVLEPSREVAVEILRDCIPGLEEHHRVSVPRELAETVVDLAKRFAGDRRLPDSALDLLDEACAVAALETPDAEEGNP